jgi:hypothetical protein
MARRRSTRQALRSESRNLKGAQSKRCSCRQTGVSSCSKHWYARNMYGIKDEICAQSLSSKPRFIAASTLSSLDPLVNRPLSSHVPTPSPALQSPSASDFTTCEQTSYRTDQPTSRSQLDIPFMCRPVAFSAGQSGAKRKRDAGPAKKLWPGALTLYKQRSQSQSFRIPFGTTFSFDIVSRTAPSGKHLFRRCSLRIPLPLPS